MPLDLTDRRQAWLALSMLDGLGPAARRHLLDHIPDPPDLFAADLLTLGGLGFNKRIQDAILQCQQGSSGVLERVAQCLTWLQQPDCHLLTFDDSGYPPLLRE